MSKCKSQVFDFFKKKWFNLWMLWFFLSLFCALITTFLDVWTKKVSEILSPFIIAQGKVFISAILIFIYFLIFKENFIDLRNILLLSLIVPLEIFALLLYIKAISFWKLSLTIPLLSITPLPLFLFSKLFLKDKITHSGIVGVLLIIFGSYILNISQYREGIFAPFVALFKEKGSRLMFIVALIFSFDSAIGKKCIEISSVSSFIFNYFVLISLGFLIFSTLRKEFFSIKDLKNLLPLGFFTFLLSIFQFTAYSLAPVVYVIALKRLSILFSVLSGKFFFKEKKILEKIFGTLIMLLGSIILGLFK